MKNKGWKISLCVLTLTFSVLSSSIGYGFMGGADIDFSMKFLCGFIFMAVPLLVIQLLLLVWRKDKSGEGI